MHVHDKYSHSLHSSHFTSNTHFTLFTLGCTAFQASWGGWTWTNPHWSRSPKAGRSWLESSKKKALQFSLVHEKSLQWQKICFLSEEVKKHIECLSRVSRTSGQILMELVWCVLRSWCRREWTAVEQRASWLAWMFHPQTTVWRWQGPPNAALWRTPYASCPSPKHLPWRILLQWSPLQTTKLHYYY